MPTTINVTERNNQLLLDAGTAFLVRELTSVEKRAMRKARKENVLGHHIQNINTHYASQIPVITGGDLESIIGGKMTQDEAVNFIIDAAFVDPFAPYELVYSGKQFNEALVKLGQILGLTDVKVRKILETKRDAIRAHIHITDFKDAISWLIRIVILMVGGILVAPLIGSALIGLGTGIFGLAFINQTLTLVGMHAMNPVMAGYLSGQMVVRGVGNLSASMIRGRGSNIDLVSAASATLELGKLQVSFNEVLLSEHKPDEDAIALLQELETDQVTLQEHLELEKTLNERYSKRVRELEITNRSMTSAIKWMQKKLEIHESVNNGK